MSVLNELINEFNLFDTILEQDHKVKTWANGTQVSWHYRSAIGHGTIKGVHKLGTSHDTTEYSIAEHDHHPGESAIVYHYGKALTRS